MDSDHSTLYIKRAWNEILLAKAIFRLSNEGRLKSMFELKEDTTFYSNVISNAYYCIFYSAKSLLYIKDVITEPPEEHKKTLEAFERIVASGEVDVDLLRVYKSVAVKADELLGIFRREKKKRGEFTYQKLPQANYEPAKESLENAEKFFKNINMIML